MSPGPANVGPVNTELLVAVLGRGVVDARERVVVADDLGLTRGDGCFDAARLVIGADGWRVDHLDRHLARFAHSCRRLNLVEPDADAWRALIAEAAVAWGRPGVATVKLVMTRGSEYLGGGQTGLLMILPGDRANYPLDVATLSRGTASDTFTDDAPWLLGGVKILSYAVNVAAKREAAKRGADDALFVSSDGFCLEGPTSGLLARFGDDWVTTPTGPTGILASCTIAALRDALADHGIAVADRLMTPAELTTADGAWLVSSVRGVCEIATLDGVAIKQDAATTAHLVSLGGLDR